MKIHAVSTKSDSAPTAATATATGATPVATPAPQPTAHFLVLCTPPAFTCWWLGVLVFHLLCLPFYLLWAFAYITMLTTHIAITLTAYNFISSKSEFPYSAGVYVAFAIPHAVHILRMVGYSVYHRRLVFTHEKQQATQEQQDQQQQEQSHVANEDPFQPPQVSCLHLCVGRIYDAFFRRDGLFGIASQHFDLVFVIQESFEIILQSVQAYRLTKWVSRSWLTRFYTICIAINCWSTVLIQNAFCKKDPAMQRLLCRAWDMAMDFTSTVIVPVIMGLPYFQMYDPTTGTLDPNLFFDNTQFVNAVNEFRMLVISSWFDLANVIVFSLLLLDCLEIVKSSVRLVPPPRCSSIQPDLSDGPSTSLQATTPPSEARGSQRRLTYWAHRLFVLWGIAIVVVQIHVETQADLPGCRRQVHPWLENRASCSFLQLHCEKAGISGTATQMQAQIRNMVPEMVRIAEFRHCDALEIPSELRSFTHLVGLKIYGSNLVRWDEDAAIVEPYFPEISFVYIVLTTLPGNQVPRGLCAGTFPAQLTDLEFAATNLSTLPENLDMIWSSPLALALDNNSFQQIPEIVTKLNVPFLSFVNNQLTSIPAALLSAPAAASYWFNGNPITSLPQQVVVGPDLIRLRFQKSELDAPLPLWMATSFLATNDGVLRLVHSPLCDRITASLVSLDANAGKAATLAALAWLGDAAHFVDTGGINCEADEGDYFTYYPYEFEATEGEV